MCIARPVPCPVAETAGSRLMADMDGGALCVLKRGALCLCWPRREDGWLHVFVPEDDLDGTLDQPGTYGICAGEDVTLWLGEEPVFPLAIPWYNGRIPC